MSRQFQVACIVVTVSPSLGRGNPGEPLSKLTNQISECFWENTSSSGPSGPRSWENSTLPWLPFVQARRSQRDESALSSPDSQEKKAISTTFRVLQREWTRLWWGNGLRCVLFFYVWFSPWPLASRRCRWSLWFSCSKKWKTWPIKGPRLASGAHITTYHHIAACRKQDTPRLMISLDSPQMIDDLVMTSFQHIRPA